MTPEKYYQMLNPQIHNNKKSKPLLNIKKHWTNNLLKNFKIIMFFDQRKKIY